MVYEQEGFCEDDQCRYVANHIFCPWGCDPTRSICFDDCQGEDCDLVDAGVTVVPSWDAGVTEVPSWDAGVTEVPSWDAGVTVAPSWDAGNEDLEPVIDAGPGPELDAFYVGGR